MRAGGGKAKGASYEREVCRRLSLWVSGGARDDIFWRSALSGGRATVQLKTGKVNVMQSGDISAIDPLGYPFCESTFVEVKHVRDLSIDRGFVFGTGDLAAYWKIACREAAKYGKRPLLIARQNRYPTLAVTSHDACAVFDAEPVIVLNNWRANVYLFDEVIRVRVPMRRRS